MLRAVAPPLVPLQEEALDLALVLDLGLELDIKLDVDLDYIKLC